MLLLCFPPARKCLVGTFESFLCGFGEFCPNLHRSDSEGVTILSNKDASGRIAKLAIELSPYAPQFDRRDAIKSQAVADFFVDWAEVQYDPPLPDPNYWTMHFDGSKLRNGLGA